MLCMLCFSGCGADWKAQAQRAAKEYLEVTPLSEKGLSEQLAFDGFTEEEAACALENTKTNWNQQAESFAKNRLEQAPSSRKALLEELLEAGFTEAQAEYGLKRNGY